MNFNVFFPLPPGCLLEEFGEKTQICRTIYTSVKGVVCLQTTDSLYHSIIYKRTALLWRARNVKKQWYCIEKYTLPRIGFYYVKISVPCGL